MTTSQKKSPKRSGKKKRAIPKERSDDTEYRTPSQAAPPHNHCYNCGISTPAGKDICSDNCQVQWDKMLRKKKLITYLPIIGGVLLILFYILVISS